MLILALDTASLVSSVALAKPGRLLAEITLQTRKTHSERLMPHIEQLLALADTDKTAIGAIAVSIGPGSFTGLRIGLATAKALAYALGTPIVGVPTLAALAFGCPVPGAILAPTMDAQKGNIYIALYRWQDGVLDEVKPPAVMPHAAAAALLAARPEPALVLGEAAELYPDTFRQAAVALAEPHVAMPRAGSVAMLGAGLLAAGERHDVMAVEPLYIRRSEAEELWEKRHGCQR
ncbi:tRNA (adenosine(37)-N6)-threonylcarbamoyltransferase complex dimerization subunit type 1 TsaB [Anaeroselena agilis]|uniref:tRNA (Adenosine(37)-N6)-threonylcarbamoyltransferase complex dimerization subunit type 1 TsaB n=1 Tax=Anaeroselena agilis TaxID=3063788 RepID=A0ABU3NT80_9FIRM|nr:tRNA (adenosine(37)-N6)-threonylcarbamoyltransferase complex dimerization subunit type 1 TsaB [Selenomonadales bacterium 4137-cl]